MALKAVCVLKGDGATQGVINLCQEVCMTGQVHGNGVVQPDSVRTVFIWLHCAGCT